MYLFIFICKNSIKKISIFFIKKNLILIFVLCLRLVYRGFWCLIFFRVSENVSMLFMLIEGNIGK